MSTYANSLRDFVKRSETRQAELAEKIGKTQPSLNRYLNNQRFPDSDTARAIDRATDGEVPFSLWQAEMAERLGFTPPSEAA